MYRVHFVAPGIDEALSGFTVDLSAPSTFDAQVSVLLKFNKAIIKGVEHIDQPVLLSAPPVLVNNLVRVDFKTRKRIV